MASMSDSFLQNQLHQFLCRWGHIFEALTEGNNGEAHALQVLHHLHSPPTVKRDLTDIEPFTETLNEFLDVTVVNLSLIHI